MKHKTWKMGKQIYRKLCSEDRGKTSCALFIKQRIMLGDTNSELVSHCCWCYACERWRRHPFLTTMIGWCVCSWCKSSAKSTLIWKMKGFSFFLRHDRTYSLWKYSYPISLLKKCFEIFEQKKASFIKTKVRLGIHCGRDRQARLSRHMLLFRQPAIPHQDLTCAYLPTLGGWWW